MADELGISSMAVRQHLQALHEAGEVVAKSVSSGKGRPTKYWRLTPEANRHFADRHRELMLDLLEGVEEVMGADGMEALLERRGKKQAEAYASALNGETSLVSLVKGLAKLRSEEGYMAEVEKDSDSGCYLVENHCPVFNAAETCPGLCEAELGVLRTVLGEVAHVERVEHMTGDSRRCVYRVVSVDGD